MIPPKEHSKILLVSAFGEPGGGGEIWLSPDGDVKGGLGLGVGYW